MPSVTQQWTFGLDDNRTPQLYELKLQHDLEKRSYFLNGKLVKDFHAPPNRQGSTKDVFEFNHTKVNVDIERVKGKFLYKLKVNNQTLWDHNRIFNQQYKIWKREEGTSKSVIIMNKTTGILFANGTEYATSADKEYTSFTHNAAKFQLLATESRNGKEFTLLCQNSRVDQINLQGTGDKICDAVF